MRKTETEISASRRTVLAGTAATTALMMTGARVFAATPDLSDVRAAIAKNHGEAVKRVQDWIALPTIAAEGRNTPQGANYMAKLATAAGFQHVEIVPTSGVPGVFATMDNGAPKTLGVYFMYDVKQFVPSEWTSPPLEAKIVDHPGMGKVMVGRGAVNQKGPEATFLAALHAMKNAGRKLPVNLVLVCEGEEEIASPHFSEIVRKPNVLEALHKCVGVMIPSPSQDTSGDVVIELGAKGVMEVELISSGAKWGRGPLKDLHSSYKAAVDSPAWHLVEALQTLVSPDGNTPAVEGWFENVKPLTQHQKDLIVAATKAQDEKKEMAALGVSHWIDDLPFDKAMIRLAEQPTINIEGLVGGYTGPGGKTILPGKAVAKLDCRLVPNMTFEEAKRKLRAHLDKHGFADIEMDVTGGYDPTQTDENSTFIQAQVATYKALGINVTFSPRSAGSWPGVNFTGAPVNLPAGDFGTGYGTGAHAPDEYYVIESANPKIQGMDDATMAYIDYMYQIATSA
jgi:acetylornithine deacetylase/succinyl-diaminopimelate desuccinylase-like protein